LCQQFWFYLHKVEKKRQLLQRIDKRHCAGEVGYLVIYDFLVIGGGISGASAAYELAAQGSVLLLEAEATAGYHSTGRSAALFTRNFGGPVVRQINATSAAFFLKPPAGFCDMPLLTPRGSLTVAMPENEACLDAVLALSELGQEVVEISPSDACEMAPFLRPDRVTRAAYEANVSDIDVASLHLAYLKGAKQRGAIITTKQPVAGLDRVDGFWKATTKTDQYRAATIINAAGAWADVIGEMVGARSIGLVPKRRTGIIIDAPEHINVSGMPAVDFGGTEIYLKPDAGRLMASPGDATPTEPHDAWPDDMDIAILADWISRETQIEVEKIIHSWAGLRSFVADEAPVVGFDPKVEGFFWLAGQGGYGIMMAPALATMTASLCISGSNRLWDFGREVSPDRLLRSD
jgi:D-arginine dehydrogenase